jgi:hypothetical protein
MGVFPLHSVKRAGRPAGAGGPTKCRQDDTPVSLEGRPERCGNQADSFIARRRGPGGARGEARSRGEVDERSRI